MFVNPRDTRINSLRLLEFDDPLSSSERITRKRAFSIRFFFSVARTKSDIEAIERMHEER